MNVSFDLATELDRRDLGIAELAREAGLSRTAVARIVAGESPGRPATRRALRTALSQFPPVAELDGKPAAAPAEAVEPLDLKAVQAENQRRLKEMERLREGPR